MIAQGPQKIANTAVSAVKVKSAKVVAGIRRRKKREVALVCEHGSNGPCYVGAQDNVVSEGRPLRKIRHRNGIDIGKSWW
jgi:hypothetical protein